MPSPVAHSLAAIALSSFSRKIRVPWVWSVLLLVVLANAADLDFIPGYITGSPGAYHWGPTHSLFAALTVGLIVGMAIGRRTGTYAAGIALATAAYGSHVLMDLTVGGPSHILVGLQLFWPVSSQQIRLGWAVFRMAPISISTAPFATLFNPQMLPVIRRELSVMAVPVAALWIFNWRRTRIGARPIEPTRHIGEDLEQNPR